VLYLSDEPAQLQALAAHPELMANAVEEGLRRRGSSVGMFRIVTQDVEVSGVRIPRHSIVWLVFQATGHDERHFPDPRRFDIHRENAGEHLSFGKGRHFCMGAPLARLEARLAMNALLARLPGLHAVPGQTLRFLPTLTVSMLDSLAVRWAL
jgi:cytochrome P450